MTPYQENRISKFLSLVLRHEPESIGISLRPGGWVAVEAVLAGAAEAGVVISPDELALVVARNDKQRFSIERGMIRANQGHSVDVDLELEPVDPPEVLYHGTVERFLASIRMHGLLKGERQHVHLSPDVETAKKVGARRGKPAILIVEAASMHRDGHLFYQSTNGVWLTDHVPPEYLTVH